MSSEQWLTFLSDYGFEDAFLGVCKGVIARTAPEVRVLDVLHLVAPQDVEQGAAVLASAVPYLPGPGRAPRARRPVPGDPGAGRRRAHRRRVDLRVSPDNGLTSPAWDVAGGAVEARVARQPGAVAPHARAHLPRPRRLLARRRAAGRRLPIWPRSAAALDVDELERLAQRAPTVESDHVHGEVVQVDHFGNLTLNLAARPPRAGRHRARRGGRAALQRQDAWSCRSCETYGEVGRGRLAVCEDSFRTVTIAVNQGSAAQRLRAGRGEPLVIGRAAPAGRARRPVELPPEPSRSSPWR